MRRSTGCNRNDGFTMHKHSKIVLNITAAYSYMPLNSISIKCAYLNQFHKGKKKGCFFPFLGKKISFCN